MRLLTLFVALVPCVLANFPDPTVFRMRDFAINVFSDKVCVSGKPYKFAFKVRSDGPHSNIQCQTDPNNRLHVTNCQLNDDSLCDDCRLRAVDSEYNSDGNSTNSYCTWGLPHNVLKSDGLGLKLLQKYYSDAIKGNFIVYWEFNMPQNYKISQIPNKPQDGTEVKLVPKI
ncbi:hypothetical protein ACQY0O_008174 [Thecaphora frezii]